MERIRDPRREEDLQVGLLKETVTLRDRAARKERERERLRELLNRGKKKRRRISSDKLVVSPRNGCTVDPSHHCLRGGTTSFSQLKSSGLSPALVICASVPRKPRSVGNRRKGKSWGQIGFDAKVQLPSAPALVEKSSPSLVQNEIEVEIAEVLYGLKKQVSPSDEPLVDGLEKIPVESENQSITAQYCSVNEASKDHSIDMNGDLGIHNHDKAVPKQEISTAEEATPNCNNLIASEVVSASMVEAKSKHQEKFVIDLMEPPPMELSPEGDGVARLTPDPQIVSKHEEMKLLPEKATVGSFLKEEVVPQKMVMKVEPYDLELDQGRAYYTGNELKQPFQKQHMRYSNPSIASAQTSPSLLPYALTGLSCPHEGTYFESKGANHGSFASVKPPDFHLIQPRRKRCATHHYIAQNIYRHQQALATKLFSPEIPQDLLSYFAKPNNDNASLSSERRVFTNLPQGIGFYSGATQQENNLRPESTVKNAHENASHQIPMPFQTGHMTAGPFISPLSQNHNVMANQDALSLSASSTGISRFSHPNGASFLAVLPGNVCTIPSSNSLSWQSSSGGTNAHPMPFLEGQLHPSQMFFPVHMQQQKNLPFTTGAISSAADIRTSGSQRNATYQSLFPRHSPNLASMPSSRCGGGQWKYAEKHGEKRNSTSSFSFASSSQSHSTNAAVPNLNFSLAQNSAVAQRFLDNTNLGSQSLHAGHGVQHRNSKMIQNINGGESMQPDGERKLAVGKYPTFIGQSGFISKSCSTTSVTTPNYKFSPAMQYALSGRIHMNNSNSLGASQNLPTRVLLLNQQQQMLQNMAASQLKVVSPVNSQHPPSIAAKVSNDFSIFSGNLFDRSRSSHFLQQRTSDIGQASEVFPASASPLCNSTLHNPQQKLAIPNSHIQI